MPRTTMADLVAQIAELKAQIAQAPASGKAATYTVTRTFACKVNAKCTKLTKSLKASESHDSAKGSWHVEQL